MQETLGRFAYTCHPEYGSGAFDLFKCESYRIFFFLEVRFLRIMMGDYDGLRKGSLMTMDLCFMFGKQYDSPLVLHTITHVTLLVNSIKFDTYLLLSNTYSIVIAIISLEHNRTTRVSTFALTTAESATSSVVQVLSLSADVFSCAST